MEDKRDHQETDRLLAVRYPNIKKPRLLLEKLNSLLGILAPVNGGNLETLIRWSQGEPQWDDITIHFRQLTRDELRVR